MIAMNGKGFGLGKFNDCTGYNISPTDVVYSIDADTYNFHLVPHKDFMIGKKTLEDCLKEKLVEIRNHLVRKLSGCDFKVPYIYSDYAKNHKYIKANYKGMEYLLLSSRLWQELKIEKEKGNCYEYYKVNNNFGQIQFMCYPEKDGQINKFGTGKTRKWRDKEIPIFEFRMMYPSSGEVQSNKIQGHFVYNPEGLTIASKSKDIADEFINFIEANS